MPVVPGLSLSQRLGRNNRLPPREAAAIVRDAARAADYAHRHGVIHCDLKPGNALLVEPPEDEGVPAGNVPGGNTQPHTASIEGSAAAIAAVEEETCDFVAVRGDRSAGAWPQVSPKVSPTFSRVIARLSGSHPSVGAGGSVLSGSMGSNVNRSRVRITDFGLARSAGQSELAGGGQIFGTPGYMAPEQAQGDHDRIGPTTDVYGLGAILYRAITGVAAVVGINAIDTVQMTLKADIVPPRRHAREIPADLQWICLQALRRRPEDRYESAAALAADLDRFLVGEPVLATAGSIAHRFVSWNRRRPLLATHFWGLLVMMVITAINFLGQTVAGGASLAYLIQIEIIFAAWLCGVTITNVLIEWVPRWADRLAALCLILDVVMLTELLMAVDDVPGQVLIGYAALVVVAGLFYRLEAVVLTTAAALVGHVVLGVVRPEVADPLHHFIFFDALLMIIGGITAFLVMRVRRLHGWS